MTDEKKSEEQKQKPESNVEQQYTKEALLLSGRWKQDLLQAVLDDKQTYTIKQVEQLVAPFLKKG